jgi:HSP20 family protein
MFKNIMSLIKWTPLSIDPFEDAFNWPAMPATFAPAVDVYEDKDNVYVESALAGINPADVAITIENNVLSLEGASQKKSEVDEKNYYRKEVRCGSFHRLVTLPTAVDGDQAKAEYENGILKIVIPKEEKAKPKNIKVEIKKK